MEQTSDGNSVSVGEGSQVYRESGRIRKSWAGRQQDLKSRRLNRLSTGNQSKQAGQEKAGSKPGRRKVLGSRAYRRGQSGRECVRDRGLNRGSDQWNRKQV